MENSSIGLFSNFSLTERNPDQSRPKTWYRKICACYWTVPLVVTVVFTVSLLVLFVLYQAEVIKDPDQPPSAWPAKPQLIRAEVPALQFAKFCTSTVCRSIGEAYSKSLNRSFDPCADFYAFTCDGLQRDYAAHKLGDDPHELTTLYRLGDAMKQLGNGYLQQLYARALRTEQAEELTASDRQLVTLFSACLERNQPKQIRKSVAVLKDLMDDCGLDWPGSPERQDRSKRRRTRLIDVIGRLSIHWGMSTPWLDFRLVPGVKDATKKIIMVTGLRHPEPEMVFNKNSVDLNAGDEEEPDEGDVLESFLWITQCLKNCTEGAGALALRESSQYAETENRTRTLLAALNVTLNETEFDKLVLNQVAGNKCLSEWAVRFENIRNADVHFELRTRGRWQSFVSKHLADQPRVRRPDHIMVGDRFGTEVAAKLLSDPWASGILEDSLTLWLMNIAMPLVGGDITKAYCRVNKRGFCHQNDVEFCSQKVCQMGDFLFWKVGGILNGRFYGPLDRHATGSGVSSTLGCRSHWKKHHQRRGIGRAPGHHRPREDCRRRGK